MSLATSDELPRPFRAGEYLHDLADAARDNPMPAALIGISALWLFTRSSRDAAARAARPLVNAARTLKAQSNAGDEDVADQAQTAGERFVESARVIQQGLADFWDAQPLIAGAAGLALGAGLATLFPTTSLETDLLGTHAGRLASQAKALVAETLRGPGDSSGSESHPALDR
jgi:hypothetical protein